VSDPTRSDDELIEALHERVAADGGDQCHALATSVEIARTEDELGFALPRLLRRIYTEVADGGFGPAYGLFPINRRPGGPGQDESLVEAWKTLSEPPLPSGLLPICEWGCAIWSFLDCRTERGHVITGGEVPFTDTGRDLRSWFAAWLSGVDLDKEMFEPGARRASVNPFTKEPLVLVARGRPRGTPWS